MSPNQTPMTEEQLDFFTQQTEHAVRKALRTWRRGAVTAFVVLAAAIGYVQWDSSKQNADGRDAIVTSGRAVAVDGCNRDFDDRKSFRDLFGRLILATDLSIERGNTTPAQGALAKAFYVGELAKLPLFDCAKSKTIVTDDPGRTTRIPDPRHP